MSYEAKMENTTFKPLLAHVQCSISIFEFDHFLNHWEVDRVGTQTPRSAKNITLGKSRHKQRRYESKRPYSLFSSLCLRESFHLI